MAQTTILAAGQTPATSGDVVVGTGARVTVGLFVATGRIPPYAGATVMLDSPGADIPWSGLSGQFPTLVLDSPGTFRIVRDDVSGHGVDVGAFVEGATTVSPAWVVNPSISGTPHDGDTLTVGGGTASGLPTPVITYQWKQGGENIGGATSETWTAVEGDEVTCVVTATNDHGVATVETVPFGPIEPALAAPEWTVDPEITGTANDGETLTVSGGTLTGYPEPVLTYQWMDGVTPIDGATESTWVAVEDATVTCVVTATNSEGSDVAETEGFGPIGAALVAPEWTVAPAISGVAEEGQTLSLSGGTVTGDPEPSLTYQWKRDGEPIEGATSATWVATAGDAVTCAIMATNVKGSDVTETAPFGPIDPAE